MSDEIDFYLKVYISSTEQRKAECFDFLLKADKEELKKHLFLPPGSEERFKMYELCIL